MNLHALGGRKFLLAVGVSLSTTLLVAFGSISDAIYATVILGTAGAFIAGNVVQDIKTPKEDRDA